MIAYRHPQLHALLHLQLRWLLRDKIWSKPEHDHIVLFCVNSGLSSWRSAQVFVSVLPGVQDGSGMQEPGDDVLYEGRVYAVGGLADACMLMKGVISGLMARVNTTSLPVVVGYRSASLGVSTMEVEPEMLPLDLWKRRSSQALSKRQTPPDTRHSLGCVSMYGDLGIEQSWDPEFWRIWDSSSDGGECMGLDHNEGLRRVCLPGTNILQVSHNLLMPMFLEVTNHAV
ncbi:hypothetical protein BD779DRAFT_1472222 [Infundibulicybe gibba]|nr:hypothetical protein BD779DRAFT_1472222 [Infundibulicybe gibba]